MNIGIDIDGVLTDIQNYNLQYASYYLKKKYNRDIVNKESYDIRDIFKCSEKEYMDYWKKYLFKYALFEPARKGAKEVVKQLLLDGHNLFIISKRVLTCRKDFLGLLMRFIVRNWLWFNSIRYNEIVFCDNDIADSKKTVCIEKDIHIMIDDEAVNINAISTITNVICYDTSYNRDCKGINIYRAKNWEEVYRIIKATGKRN